MGDELRSTISDEALDRQLRDAAPYIDDDGFTTSVLRRLPAAQAPRQSIRSAILIALTLLGSALAYIVSDSGRFIVVSLVRLAHLPPLVLATLALGIGLLVTSGALITAVAKVREVES
jgi:ABC-type spermidine/putrescine transport system permease subunit II